MGSSRFQQDLATEQTLRIFPKQAPTLKDFQPANGPAGLHLCREGARRLGRRQIHVMDVLSGRDFQFGRDPVNLADLVIMKESIDFGLRLCRLCENQKSFRRHVETVGGKGGAPEFVAKAVENVLPPIIERGMNGCSRRLIDDHHVVVFINKIRFIQRKAKTLRLQVNPDDGVLVDRAVFETPLAIDVDGAERDEIEAC